jgi:hypothetical protein
MIASTNTGSSRKQGSDRGRDLGIVTRTNTGSSARRAMTATEGVGGTGRGTGLGRTKAVQNLYAVPLVHRYE